MEELMKSMIRHKRQVADNIFAERDFMLPVKDIKASNPI